MGRVTARKEGFGLSLDAGDLIGLVFGVVSLEVVTVVVVAEEEEEEDSAEAEDSAVGGIEKGKRKERVIKR